MSVVQESIYIPDDIAVGLATGQYRRIGSVVRYAVGSKKGEIVKHLEPVDMKVAEETMGLGEKVFRFVKKYKKGNIILVAGFATVGVGVWVYRKMMNNEPKVVSEFRSALRMYIDAIHEGSMDIDKIDKLMTTLEELKKYKKFEKISIQLTTEDLEAVVSRIYDYTIKVAKDNGVEWIENELIASRAKNSGTIINLQNYLKVQKRIFEEVE